MSLEIFLGPMFSGKTTRLMQIYHIHSYLKPSHVAVVNFEEDLRYGSVQDGLISHNQLKIPCLFLRQLSDLPNRIDYKLLLINEAQFFPDVKNFVLESVEKYGQKVVLFGLDGDFMRRPIGSLLDLIPYCDYVEKLKAYCSRCRDGTEALFSHRLTDSKEVKCIGGAETYQSLCRKCWLSRV